MKKGMRVSLKFKAVVLIVLITVFISALTAYISYHQFEKTNETGYKEEAHDLASTTALLVDADAMKAVMDRTKEIFESIPNDELVTSDDWGSPEFNAYLENYSEIYEMPEFKTLLSQLEQVQHLSINTLSSVYTSIYLQQEGDDTVYAVYLVDAAGEDACPPGVLDCVDGADYSSFKDNTVGMEPYITHTEMYGWLVTAGVPVFTDQGEYAGMVVFDLSMDDIKAKEQRFLMTLIVIMIFIVFAVIFVAVSVMNTFVVDPIKQLSQTVLVYVKEKDKGLSFKNLDRGQNDEISDLQDSFIQMETDLNEHIRRITEMTSEKERLETELDVAAKIQMDMLPHEFPDNSKYSIYASIKPAKDVGGDFYDFFMIDEDRLGLVMADVSGKGIPASLFMVISKNTIYNRSLRGDEPAQILRDVNQRLCENNAQHLFVTVWLGILTLSTGELVMANAGHENPVIKRASGKYEMHISEHCPPLGLDEEIEFTEEKLTLGSGDILFVYTDGVTEAKNKSGKRWGDSGLMDCLNHSGRISESAGENEGACEGIITGINRSLDEFVEGAEQFDDITMMVVKMK